MIQERYCSFDVARLLKEKGFDEPCRTYYGDDKFNNDVCNQFYQWNSKSPFGHISAPTHQMACDWLREKGIFMYVEPFITISSRGYNLEGYKPWVTEFKKNWFNPLHEQGKVVYTKS